jgi:SAM-dependent methyltransferase
MEKFEKYIETNKKAWNTKTPVHLRSAFYNNEEFKKGKTSLKSIELDAIGEVKGKSLLHLQCHFGQDSISLARMGAKVTAVDFCAVAIAEAKSISKEINTDVRFLENDVLSLDLKEEFDIIFSSYGAIGWLPELNKWGATVSKHLKKGGTFLLTEFHPFIDLLDENQYDYFYKEEPDIELENGTYTDGGENLKIRTCWWNHSLTDIFTALESNGLKLKFFQEFDFSPYCLRGMTEKSEGKFVLEKRINQKLPYVFNLKATKK